MHYPTADTYVRYFDYVGRHWVYTHLVESDAPQRYPVRFAALAPGAEQSQPTVFTELQPSAARNHVYLAFLGLYPGFRYKLFHPYNIRSLLFDERIVLINDALTAVLLYDDSPHDDPRKPVWITPGRYPGIQPTNIGDATAHPKVLFYVVKYRAVTDGALSADVKARLSSGAMPSLPITIGGEL